MQVVWEANTADFAKRKRAARACASCQKRKKRCHHTFSQDSAESSSITDEHDLDRVIPNFTHKEPVRFVGDLNPESILTDLSSRSKGAPRENSLGTWVSASPELQHHFDEQNAAAASKIICAAERYRQVERGRRTLTGHQKNYLQAVGAFRVLPKATQDVLITSYIACMDSLLPIINGRRLLKEYTAGTASTFLVQAICLVACKTEDVAPYLRLTEDGPLLDPIPFARIIHTGLDAAMKADLEADRLTKVQILALMSLHNDGPGGLEESSMHLVQAIHDAHTAGLHVLTRGRETNDEASYTWWSIWVLDKLNACLGGRAIMIADRDVGLPRPQLEQDEYSRSHALQLWLALADVLAEVISYYRPTADQDSTGWEENFPTFQEVSFRNAKIAVKFDIPLQSHRNLVELFYNVIAILTCRSGGPSTLSYRRRVIAAGRIQQLMTSSIPRTSSIASPTEQQHENMNIPPLPLVPYAVSLSLTVAYRLLRDKYSPSSPSSNADIEQVKADLAVRCSLLESLSSRWWSADAMAKLGRKALKSLKSGVDGHLGEMMEAETAVCKFAPFGVNDPGHSGAGNGLEVLSSAAAVASGYQHHDQNQMSGVELYPTPSDSVGGTDVNALPMLDGYTSTISTEPGLSNTNTTGMQVNQFQELDMLFGDFFDVGMPTFFEDPLFGGDAFASYDGFGDFPAGLEQQG